MFKKGIVLLNLFFATFMVLSVNEIEPYQMTGTKQITERESYTQNTFADEEIQGNYVKDRLLIKYLKPEISQLASFNVFSSAFVVSYEEINTAALKKGNAFMEASKDESVWLKAKLEAGTDIQEAIREVMKIPGVIDAEPDYIRELQIDGNPVLLNFIEDNMEAVPLTDDELLNQQYYLDKVNISEARGFLEENSINPGGAREIIVAVIDTGVDYNHPELVPNMWINPNEERNGMDDSGSGLVDDIHGASFIGNDWSHHGDPMDTHGHGTHVAGIIAAKGNNQIGIRGVADNVRIMAIKAAGSSGIFNTSDIVESINYAVQNGADVINMSFGGYARSNLEREALELAFNKAVLVAAAGNDTLVNLPSCFGKDMYPAAYPFVIGVMASNEFDMMASFSNFDYWPQDSHEYEIVAPGSGIISILPNERYAKWDGSSMSAPIISGIAALLKSYYNDPSSHSSRFIMGQLIGTADHPITIPSFMSPYTMHSVFYQANAYNAFISTPKPELSMFEHYIFDSPDININNNGNGVIDAGETIDLAVMIRNHWGKAGNVTVSIDTETSGGLEDPYINIIQNNIYYGDVGTFSSKDNGMVYDENSVITNVENPFIIEVDPDTPNDYHIILNVTINGYNGLDPTDETIYNNLTNGQPQKIHLTIRNGRDLPTEIVEDMVLTNDTFWIIPNATIIPEGVTVTVEEGTSIQFWSNEPEDVYADQTLAYLKVEGKFIVEGTEENPVKMFPSDLKAEYPVMIFSGDFNGSGSLWNGFNANDNVEISYAEITNPNIGASIIDHAKFNQNYNYMIHRWIENGEIIEREWYSTRVNAQYISNSIFSRLGSTETYLFCCAVNHFKVSGILEGNLFDSVYMDPNSEYAQNNVFLNNYILEETQIDDLLYYTSISRNLGRAIEPDNMFKNFEIRRNSQTGTTYIRFEMYNASYRYPPVDVAQSFAESLGGHMVSINSQEEENFLRQTFGSYYFIGLKFDPTQGYVWMSGEEVDYTNWADSNNHNVNNHKYVTMNWNGWEIGHTHSYYMIEIPGDILLEDIILFDQEITLSEMSDPYQIPFDLYPNNTELNQVYFNSSDETVVTVDNNGFLTPVSIGQAVVTVTNYDDSIAKEVTVNITEHVGLTDFNISSDINTLEVGMVKRINVSYLPTNTTERLLTWTSSDETVLSVDKNGVVTALSTGQATISAASPDGQIVKSLTFDVIQYATEISVDNTFVVMAKDETHQLQTNIEPLDSTHKDVIYESSNDLVVSIDENGLMTAHDNGTVIVRVTLVDSKAYTELVVSVTETVLDEYPVKQILSTYDSNNTRFYALMENGDVWTWGQNDILPVKLDLTNIVSMASRSSQIIMFDEQDNIYYMDWMDENLDFNTKSSLSDIKNVSVGSSFYLVLTHDGSVWGWGSNYHGQLGTTQTDTWVNQEIQLDIQDNIVDILAMSNTSYFLTDDGRILTVGYSYDGNVTEFREIEGISNANALFDYSYLEIIVLTDDDQVLRTSINNNTYQHINMSNVVSYSRNENHEMILLSDGSVFTKGPNNYGELGLGHFTYGNQFQMINQPNIITQIHAGNSVSAILSETGDVYVFGKNHQGQLADLTNNNSALPIKVHFGLEEDDTPLTVLSTNPENNENYVGREDVIEIVFNQAIKSSSNYAYIRLLDSEDKYIPINKYIYLNKLYIEPTIQLEGEKPYRIEIMSDSLISLFGQPNNQINLSYTTEPGELYVKNITVANEDILLSDNGQTHQIEYVLDPYLVDETYIEWSSADETIVTVDEFGVLTPISVGETTVTVKDLPGTIIRNITVKVQPYKAIDSFEISTLNVDMNVGEVYNIVAEYLPLDTTETMLNYEVADEAVLTVDNYGHVTALAGGQTSIIVSSPHLSLAYTIQVSVSEIMSDIVFEEDYFITSVNVVDTFNPPLTYPLTATETDITYESSNPDVAYVNEFGELIKLTTGVVVIRANASIGDAFDEIIVSVDDYDTNDSIYIVDSKPIYYSYSVVSLAKDGSVWVHGRGSEQKTPIKMDIDSVQQIDGTDHKFGALTIDGYVYYSDGISNGQPNLNKVNNLNNVIKISVSDNHILMLTEDGKLWGMGYNYYGQLGAVKIGENISEPLELLHFSNIKDFIATEDKTYVLTNDGQIQYIGGSLGDNQYLTTLTTIDNLIVDSIVHNDSWEIVVKDTNNKYHIINNGDVTEVNTDGIEGEYIKYNDAHYILTTDGDVFAKGDNNYNKLGLFDSSYYSNYTQLENLENIVNIIPSSRMTIFINNEGEMFVAGRNSDNQHVNFKPTSSVYEISKIPFGYLYDNRQIEVTSSNPVDGYDVFEVDGQIIVEFNKIIQPGEYFPFLRLIDENDVYVDITREIYMNRLIITPTKPLSYDMNYRLSMPDYSFIDLYNQPSYSMNINFTTEPEVLYVRDILVYDEDIYLRNSLEHQYQIQYEILPSVLDQTYINFTSSNPEVVTVDEYGLLTPTGIGNTTIVISSLDNQIIKEVNVYVSKYKALDSFEFTEETMNVMVGDVLRIPINFNPTDSTEKELTYSSSDETVAIVDESGFITFLTGGQVEISAVDSTGLLTDSVSITVDEPVESITFDSSFMLVNFTDEIYLTPEILPATATNQQVVYESSDETIAYVDETGKLIPVSEGVVVIRATSHNQNIYDEIIISINENTFDQLKTVDVVSTKFNENIYSFALMNDGSVWYWNKTISFPVKLPYENIIQISSGRGYSFMMLDANGKVYLTRSSNLSFNTISNIPNVKEIAAASYHYLMLTESGDVFGFGDSNYGRLGNVQTSTWIETPIQISGIGDVKSIRAVYYGSYYLLNDGTVQYTGYRNNGAHAYEPISFAGLDLVDSIYSLQNYHSIIAKTISGEYYYLDYINEELISVNNMEGLFATKSYDNNYFFIDNNNDLWVKGNNNSYALGLDHTDYVNEWTKHPTINNVSHVYSNFNTTYIIDTSGKLLVVGNNSFGQVGPLYPNIVEQAEQIYFGMLNDERPIEIKETYPENNEMYFELDDTIRITFNKAVYQSNQYHFIQLKDTQGNLVPASIELRLNELIITPTEALNYETRYQLSIPESALVDAFNNENTSLNILFRTRPEVIAVDDIIINENEIFLTNDNLTYQLDYNLIPSLVDETYVVFETNNIDVVDVDEFGLLTINGLGQAIITIKTLDESIIKTINVSIIDKVDLIDFAIEPIIDPLNTGYVYQLDITYTPEDTTERNLTYSSSDESVAIVNEKGYITALSNGLATITISNGTIEKTIDIEVITKLETIAFEERFYVTDLTALPTALDLVVTPIDASNQNINWISSNESIAYFNDQNELVVVQAGNIVVRAELANDESVYAEMVVSVHESLNDDVYPVSTYMNAHSRENNASLFALMSDGTVKVWGEGRPTPITLNVGEKIIDMAVSQYDVIMLTETGIIYYGSAYQIKDVNQLNQITSLENIIEVAMGYSHYMALDSSGNVWGWGYNNKGELASSEITSFNIPRIIYSQGDAIDIGANRERSIILNDKGEVFILGGQENYSEPYLINNLPFINRINKYAPHEAVLYSSNGDIYAINEYNVKTIENVSENMRNRGFDIIDYTGYFGGSQRLYLSRDGRVIVYGSNDYMKQGLGDQEYIAHAYRYVYGLDNVQSIVASGANGMVLTNEHEVYVWGHNGDNQLSNGESNHSGYPTLINLNVYETSGLQELTQYPENASTDFGVGEAIQITFDQPIVQSRYFDEISLINDEGYLIPIDISIEMTSLVIKPLYDLDYSTTYSLNISDQSIGSLFGEYNNSKVIQFTTQVLPADIQSYEGIQIWTTEILEQAKDDFFETEFHSGVYNNAILNNLVIPETDMWMRFISNSGSEVRYLNYNYWGTIDEFLISKQIRDYVDYPDLQKIEYMPFLMKDQLESIYPFVVDAYTIDENLEKTQYVGIGEQTFVVEFNRDMDTTEPLSVYFGPDFPFTDYKVDGTWIDAKTWEGTFNITPLTGDGRQFFRINNGRAADDHWLEIGDDESRFVFEIRTASAESMNLHANSAEGRVILSWLQDDFDMLAGYNVYRSQTIDGDYQKVNSTVIPNEDKEYSDYNIEPGQIYYYKFTVVKTDLTESDYSNIVGAAAYDTIAPTMNHRPITETNIGVDISFVVTAYDNISIDKANVYYRAVGEETYKVLDLTSATNNQYKTQLFVGEAYKDGLEYYIEIGDSLTDIYSGSAEFPHQIIVHDYPTLTSVTPAKGTSVGDTLITISGSNFKEGATVYFGEFEGLNVEFFDENTLLVRTPQNIPSQVNVRVVNPSGDEDILTNAYEYTGDNVQMEVATTRGRLDQEILVPVRVNNVVGLLSADFKVTYNSNHLSYLGHTKGNIATRFNTVVNDQVVGELTISMASDIHVGGSGEIIFLKFKVLVDNDSVISLSDVLLNGGAIQVETYEGEFIIDYVYNVTGNVYYYSNNTSVSEVKITLVGEEEYITLTDENGEFTVYEVDPGNYDIGYDKLGETDAISAYDAAMILRYSANLDSLGDNQLLAADVNNDGAVNSFDAAMILQFVSGLKSLPFNGRTDVWEFYSGTEKITDLNTDINLSSVMAILIGDVSGNYQSSQSQAIRSGYIGISQLHLDEETNQITMPVNVRVFNEDIYAIETTITYNPSLMVKEVIFNEALADYMTVVNTNEAGVIKVVIAGVEALIHLDNMFKVVYEKTINDIEEYTFTIENTLFNENENIIEVNHVLKANLIHDVNLDGVVDHSDFIELIDMLNTSFRQKDVGAYDYNHDGIIDIYDIIMNQNQ